MKGFDFICWRSYGCFGGGLGFRVSMRGLWLILPLILGGCVGVYRWQLKWRCGLWMAILLCCNITTSWRCLRRKCTPRSRLHRFGLFCIPRTHMHKLCRKPQNFGIATMVAGFFGQHGRIWCVSACTRRCHCVSSTLACILGVSNRQQLRCLHGAAA